jgi:hypothetical protein
MRDRLGTSSAAENCDDCEVPSPRCAKLVEPRLPNPLSRSVVTVGSSCRAHQMRRIYHAELEGCHEDSFELHRSQLRALRRLWIARPGVFTRRGCLKHFCQASSGSALAASRSGSSRARSMVHGLGSCIPRCTTASGGEQIGPSSIAPRRRERRKRCPRTLRLTDMEEHSMKRS